MIINNKQNYLTIVLPLLIFIGIVIWSQTNLSHQLTTFFLKPITTQAIDPVDEIQAQIDELNKLKKLSQEATTPLERELKGIENKITTAQNKIKQAQLDLIKLTETINQREIDLASQYLIFSQRVRDQYKQSRSFNPLTTLFDNQSASQNFQELTYKQLIQARNNQLIKTTASQLAQLETDKQKLELQKQRLTNLQQELNTQAQFFASEISKAKSYQQDLSQKIQTLSAQQQAIINSRSGTYTTSVGEVPLADDFNASIAYKERAPHNSFAVFSFGGYTHRNGMSQYGAKARAESGQSVEDILKAYYPHAKLKKDYPQMDNILVNGIGSISFEDRYLQGIYEMPSSWHINALKAQAIAARTYALLYTNNGQKSICTNESCQVFKNSPKGGAWQQAVNETRGWILVDDQGQPTSTQYASTHGGYTNTSGWDTTNKTNSANWSNEAWESKAKSPWFYKAWYREGYLASGNSCGRSHPWLSQEEFSDIINAWIVKKNPNGADISRIKPTTIKSCGIGGAGANSQNNSAGSDPYSIGELRHLANNSGGAVTNITGVQVTHNERGQTVSVRFQTNRGEINLSGNEFKNIFNLRAPGYLRIPQNNFSFYNIEWKM